MCPVNYTHGSCILRVCPVNYTHGSCILRVCPVNYTHGSCILRVCPVNYTHGSCILRVCPVNYTHGSCILRVCPVNYTHLWPISWAMVNAVLSPLSLLMLQLLVGSHALPTSAIPATNHIEDKYTCMDAW